MGIAYIDLYKTEAIIDLFKLRRYNLELFVFNIINFVLMICCVLFFLIYFVYFLVSCFKHKSINNTCDFHKYAVLVKSKSYNLDLKRFLDSFVNASYDKDKLKLYICLDEYDDTPIEGLNGIDYEVYTNKEGNCVSYKYLIDCASSNNIDDINGFFFFDSKDEIDKDFFIEMNKFIDKKYLVVTPKVLVKELSKSLILASWEIDNIIKSSVLNSSRSRLKMNAFLNQSGYYISKDIIMKTSNIKNNLEFSIWCSTNGISIGYNESAICYSYKEKTLKTIKEDIKNSFNEIHSDYSKYSNELIDGIKKSKRKLSCFELLVHILPLNVYISIWIAIYITAMLIFKLLGAMTWKKLFVFIFINNLSFIFLIMIVAMLMAVVAFAKNKEYIKSSLRKKIVCTLLYPFFVLWYNFPKIYTIHFGLEKVTKQNKKAMFRKKTNQS